MIWPYTLDNGLATVCQFGMFVTIILYKKIVEFYRVIVLFNNFGFNVVICSLVFTAECDMNARYPGLWSIPMYDFFDKNNRSSDSMDPVTTNEYVIVDVFKLVVWYFEEGCVVL